MFGDEITQINSNAFRFHQRFHSCVKYDWAHIKRGDKGEHVRRLQDALFSLLVDACMHEGHSDHVALNSAKINRDVYPGAFPRNGYRGGGDGIYGPDTAAVVLNYKAAMRIKRPNQQYLDDTLGIMTMKSMEKHMRRLDAEQPGAWG